MKAVVFVSHPIGVFLLQSLAKQGNLAAIVIPDRDTSGKESFLLISQLCKVPLIEVSQKQMVSHLMPKLERIQPDVILVNTFPYLIAKEIFANVRYGGWNFHCGMLPKYRGPIPIFWQILNGETKGEMCLHQLTETFDAGPIFAREERDMHPMDTHDTFLNRISQTAPKLAEELFEVLGKDELRLEEQNKKHAKYYAKPTLEDMTIKWDKMNGAEIKRLVRACNPIASGALTWLRGLEVRVCEVEVFPIDDPPDKPAGTIVEIPDDPHLYVLCKDSTCMRVSVLMSTDAVTSGLAFRQLFEVSSGERFGERGVQ